MSLVSWWVTLKTKRSAALQLIVAILLLGVGYQVGRVMSPYYAASPIVFEDRGSSSGGTLEELVELKEQGITQREPKAEVAATSGQPATTTAQPTVAAATTAGESTGLFVGSVNSDLYHHRDCSWSRIKEENRIWWQTQQEAEAAGYKPSKCTVGKLP